MCRNLHPRKWLSRGREARARTPTPQKDSSLSAKKKTATQKPGSVFLVLCDCVLRLCGCDVRGARCVQMSCSVLTAGRLCSRSPFDGRTKILPTVVILHANTLKSSRLNGHRNLLTSCATLNRDGTSRRSMKQRSQQRETRKPLHHVFRT